MAEASSPQDTKGAASATRTASQRVAFRLYKNLVITLSQHRASKAITLVPDEIGRLNYFQYNVRTTEFLKALTGDNSAVPVAATPHAAYARSIVSGNPDTTTYEAYLRTSWGDPENSRVSGKVATFKLLVEAFQQAPTTIPPVVLTQIGKNGPYHVVDGNHRSAIAYALRQPLRAIIIPLQIAITRCLSGRYVERTLPKLQLTEEMYFNDSVGIPGPYSERSFLDVLPASCIQSKRILDIGCGFGARAILAREMGAKSVTGIDERSSYADIAARMATLTGSWPDVRIFASLNGLQSDTANMRFDTVFLKITALPPDHLTQNALALRGMHWQTLCIISGPNFQPAASNLTATMRGRELSGIDTRRSSRATRFWLFEKPQHNETNRSVAAAVPPKTAERVP